LYELERNGRTVYSNSLDVVSVLLERGWAMRDADRWARIAQRPKAGLPPVTLDPAKRWADGGGV
jgi:hypothetical protein